MLQKTLSDGEVLRKILTLLENSSSGPPQSRFRVYSNAEIKELLKIKDRYLKKLRDNGFLGYSREGDKYWYTQEAVDRFLRRFHFKDFATSDSLPPY